MTERTITLKIPKLYDIEEAAVVEITWAGYTLWVNVEGECVLRIQKVKELFVQGEPK
jgi:hypothetical protein